LELPRFAAHLISAEKGVHNAKNESAVCGGVSAPDGGVGL